MNWRTVFWTVVGFELGVLVAVLGQWRETRLLREETERFADALFADWADHLGQRETGTMLELMRGGRDVAASVLLAHERGLDIDADLRVLVRDLSDQIAQFEEHVP